MAKSSTCNISIRMDSNLKAAAEALYEELGMNLSTAFNIFVRQSLRERGIPFKITEGTPSKETVSAMLEAERIAKDPTVKGYHDVDEFFANLDSCTKLANGEVLAPKHKDHPLSGDWVGHRECHIQPDWLLVYRYDNDVLVLTLSRTSTHSDLFGL